MPTPLSLKPSIGLVAGRIARGAIERVATACAAWQRQRFARAAVRALNGLDARTLRDLGLDRSELSSLAAELAGEAARQRVRATPIAEAAR